MNSDTMVHWTHAMIAGMGHGGKQRAAKTLGISPSGLSRLLNSPGRGYDEKTLKAVAWVETSKSAKWPIDQFPIESESVQGPVIIEIRRGESGSMFPTWRKVTDPKPVSA